MKLPATVSNNTYIAYKNNEYLEKERKLKAEEFSWDIHHPKTLVIICIEQLSASWMGNPKLSDFVTKDRDMFLQVLKTDVPIQTLVDNIKNDIFWKRFYYFNWTEYPLFSEQKPWINIFMEKYYADIIENMNPRQYDPEKVNKLVKLCCPYIGSLEIRSLIPVDMPDINRITSPEMANLVTSRQHNRQKKTIKNDEPITRGPSGIESISHVLNYVTCGLRSLDLRLNNQLGSEGIAHVAVALARGCNLISLNISGCGITPEPLLKPPAGVWSTTNAEKPPTCGELLARAIGLVKTPLRSLDISVNNIGSPSDKTLSNAICLSYLVDINLKQSGMGATAMAISESAAAAQKLRREEEKGIKFRRSAGRLMQARRVVKGMNIDADPLLLAQQLSARPSIVSVASEEGVYNIQTFPLPSDFGFVPSLKSPLALSNYETPTTAPSTSRRSSQNNVLESVKEISFAPILRRKSDGSLIQKRNGNRHIRIFVSNEDD